MELHVIVGAGPVGKALANQLLEKGARVRVVTRSGGGVEGAEQVAADASDADRLAELAEGAVALYNCANPPYHQWAQTWPALAGAMLTAAERSGAILATTANLYGYGEVDSPMVESTSLDATGTKGRVRNQMWADALAAHRAGRVRAFEARGSDYLGGNSLLATIVTPAWSKGRTALLPADLDVPHSFTDVRAVAQLLVAGVEDERAWGAAWHVPTADPVTIRELCEIAAAQCGVEAKVRALPYAAVWAYGLFDPFVKELRETQHQFRKPYVLDSAAAQAAFGLRPPTIEDSVAYDLACAPLHRG